MTLSTIFAACAVTVTCGAAVADEMWELPDKSTIYYETDVGATAVFRIDDGNSLVRFYLPGFANQLDDRGTHHGYWIEDKGGSCDASLTGPDGLASSNWGRIIVTFDETSFPSGWTALVGECFDQPDFGVRAVSTALQ